MTRKLAPTPKELRSDAEAELARTPPDKAPVRSAEELLYELQVHQIELEMQNEALRQAQIALEESRDRYVDLYEFAPVGYLTLDSNGLIAEINLTGAILLGRERQLLLRSRFAHHVGAADRDRWHRFFLAAQHARGRTSLALTMQRGDGTGFHARIDCAGAGRSSLRVVLSDLTERKQAEDAD